MLSSLLAIWYTSGTNLELGVLANTSPKVPLTLLSFHSLNHMLHRRYTTWRAMGGSNRHATGQGVGKDA